MIFFGPIFADLSVKAEIVGKAAVGPTQVRIFVRDRAGKPAHGAKVVLRLEMTSMTMGVRLGEAKETKAGEYEATIQPSMAGPWRATVHAELAGDSGETELAFRTGAPERAGDWSGKLGTYSMSRDGSGTSWLPDESPMRMVEGKPLGTYRTGLMGFITANESNTSGPRGHYRVFSNSMLMGMARKSGERDVLDASVMVSLDPVFNGRFGYPNLFQTGETAYGEKLTDWQHPHDFLSEATVSYSRRIREGLRAFVYGGPIGEPALGGPMFAHRPGGMEIPEAPISHHWFDSTHISSGVATVGLNTDRWQLETSAFNGREPDEHRFDPDPIRLNSGSARFTLNPNRNWSLSASYGYLHSPEATEPEIDQHRITASALFGRISPSGDSLAATAYFARRFAQDRTDAFGFEATWEHRGLALFSRIERVEEDELAGAPPGKFPVTKALIGAVKNIASPGSFELGAGAFLGFYQVPAALQPLYGSRPTTLGFFLRLRPKLMNLH